MLLTLGTAKGLAGSKGKMFSKPSVTGSYSLSCDKSESRTSTTRNEHAVQHQTYLLLRPRLSKEPQTAGKVQAPHHPQLKAEMKVPLRSSGHPSPQPKAILGSWKKGKSKGLCDCSWLRQGLRNCPHQQWRVTMGNELHCWLIHFRNAGTCCCAPTQQMFNSQRVSKLSTMAPGSCCKSTCKQRLLVTRQWKGAPLREKINQCLGSKATRSSSERYAVSVSREILIQNPASNASVARSSKKEGLPVKWSLASSARKVGVSGGPSSAVLNS